jgi:MFS family permease
MESTKENAPIPVDLRRNIAAFFADIFNWNVGTYFIPISTVLTALAARLTEDKALIGMVGLAWSAGWALPQLIGARLIHGKPRKLPYVVRTGAVGRQFFLILGLWLVFTQARDPLTTVLLLIVCVLVFAVADGFATVAWFDLIAKSVSSKMRNRIFSVGNIIATVIGLLANTLIVRSIFASPNITFPNNYATVILIGWGFIFVSWISVNFVREPISQEHEKDAAETPSFIHGLMHAFQTDKIFRQVLIARTLTALEYMAASFYIVFATEQLRLSDSSIGDFNIAYNVGSLSGSVLLAWIAERFGSRGVIRIASVFQLLAPLITLAVAFMGFSLQIGLWLMLIVSAINGIVNHSVALGFLNYTLDIATEKNRGMYVGAVNVLYGIMALTPPIGGLLINTFGYSVMLLLVSVLVLIGAIYALQLPKVTHQETPA